MIGNHPDAVDFLFRTACGYQNSLVCKILYGSKILDDFVNDVDRLRHTSFPDVSASQQTYCAIAKQRASVFESTHIVLSRFVLVHVAVHSRTNEFLSI